MAYCRGPLPDGHPHQDVTYFSIDHDIALQACNLRSAPAVTHLRHVCTPAVLLDAHRAPDEWFAIACTMDNLLIQGDPEALRPPRCNVFARELEKVEKPASSGPRVRLECVDKLSSALALAQGRYVVLVGSYTDRPSVYAHLRPDGFQKGDAVMDMHGRRSIVSGTTLQTHVETDLGRRMLLRSTVTHDLVVSPSCVRAGEYDTIIVMPGVPESVARAVSHRVRYMIIGVAHSPYGYITCQ